MNKNYYDRLSQNIYNIVKSSAFQKTIIGLIVLSSLLLGLETNSNFMSTYGHYLHGIDKMIVLIFALEIILKLIANGRKPLNYFKDGWNVMDFLIVVGCLMPSGSSVIAVFRLVRVLRVFRLVTTMPKLQLIITGFIKSLPSLGSVFLLLSLHFYMYSVLGTFLFGKNDPVNFGSLSSSMLTLFQTLTLEGWVEFLRIQMYGCMNYGYESFQNQCVASDAKPMTAVLYFISFIIFGTMCILNLLVGSIVNGMSESNEEASGTKDLNTQPKDDYREAIEQLTIEVRSLRDKMQNKAS